MSMLQCGYGCECPRHRCQTTHVANVITFEICVGIELLGNVTQNGFCAVLWHVYELIPWCVFFIC